MNKLIFDMLVNILYFQLLIFLNPNNNVKCMLLQISKLIYIFSYCALQCVVMSKLTCCIKNVFVVIFIYTLFRQNCIELVYFGY